MPDDMGRPTAEEILTDGAYLNVDAVRMYELLQRCIEETGMLPQWYFEHMPRVFPQACIELAVMTVRSGKRHIFLLQRPDNDTHWPRQWHMPGTTLYPKDSEETMWKRLLASELGQLLRQEMFRLAFNHISTREERERGECMHAVYTGRIGTASKKLERFGTFFPVDQLPEEVIQHHRTILTRLTH